MLLKTAYGYAGVLKMWGEKVRLPGIEPGSQADSKRLSFIK